MESSIVYILIVFLKPFNRILFQIRYTLIESLYNVQYSFILSLQIVHTSFEWNSSNMNFNDEILLSQLYLMNSFISSVHYK